MNIRQQALETLLRINYEGAYSNLETKKVLSTNDINAEDWRLYLNIVYGCLQNLSYLDYIIKQQSSKPIKELHKEVSEIRKSLKLEGTRIRLLGVTISNLETDECDDRQLYLFEDWKLPPTP